MTKRQWFLVAGTIVLAGCPGFTATEVCEENDDTGWTECSAIQTAQPAETPAQSIDLPEDPSET